MKLRAEALSDETYKIAATVSNTGFMPTNVTNRGIITRMAKPVFVTADQTGASIISMSGSETGSMYGKEGLLLGHIAGWKNSGTGEGTRGESVANHKTVEFIVKKVSENAEIIIQVLGQRAGKVKKVIKL